MKKSPRTSAGSWILYTFEMICEEGPCACPGQGEKGCGA